MRIRTLLLAGIGALLAGSQAQALSFSCISDNDANQCLIGEQQFSASVSDLGSGQVQITFANAGPEDSFIAQVYIDDGASVFSSIASIQNGTGTNFASPATPGNLPSGNDASPAFAADFSAGAVSPGTDKDGADPGESFSLIMNLAAGKTFADVQAAFELGSVRLGIHGQGLGATGGSESFVNGGGGENAVPEPTAALLFGAGVLAVSQVRRRR